MKKVLILCLLLVGCDLPSDGIKEEVFNKMLDTCDVPMISLELLSDEQLIVYGRHQQMCEEQDNYSEGTRIKNDIHPIDWNFGGVY